MVDIKKEVVQALNKTNIPVNYELFIDETKIPCISYVEVNNADRLTGSSLEYSDIAFQITLWTRDVAEAAKAATIIDSELKALGFKRRSCNEFIQGSIIQKIFRYEAIGFKKL